MKRNLIIAVVAVLIVVALGSWYLLNRSAQAPTTTAPEVSQPTVTPPPEPVTPTAPVEKGAGTAGATILYTASGFSPATLTVKAGTAVVFKNDSASDFWPASAIHPTHRVYPGSGIEKCGTAEEGNIFDACRPLGPGTSYTFTFNQKGTWKYHDHLNPSKTGTIVVQ
jgi:plastocyanin